jgi:hypothetical protein
MERTASTLAAAGAACVTVMSDREGDIYEDFALRPQNVEMLVRAAQDRRLVDGSHLFALVDTLDEAGQMTIELPAAPGREARTAVLALRFGTVEIFRPLNRGRCSTAAIRRTDICGRPRDQPPAWRRPSPLAIAYSS